MFIKMSPPKPSAMSHRWKKRYWAPLPENTKLVAYVMMIGMREEMAINCIVRWVKPTGSGVQFMGLTDAQVYKLMELVASIRSGSRAQPERGDRAWSTYRANRW